MVVGYDRDEIFVDLKLVNLDKNQLEKLDGFSRVSGAGHSSESAEITFYVMPV